MKLVRLDDYQSWRVEAGGLRLAIDPWLTAEHALPPGHWLFGRRREAAPACGVAPLADLDALIVTGVFADHCDPATLAHVKRDVRCFAERAAARRLEKLGFQSIEVLRPGTRHALGAGVSLEAVAPGFPYSGNSVGFVLEADGKRLGFETHVVAAERHRALLSGLDCLVMPVQGVRLVGVPFVMSPARALEVIGQLGPRAVVPTGNDPQRGHGLLSSLFLSYRGTVEGFGERLRRAAPQTRWAPLGPGESLAL